MVAEVQGVYASAKAGKEQWVYIREYSFGIVLTCEEWEAPCFTADQARYLGEQLIRLSDRMIERENKDA
jgi:hypothetical protein